MGKVYLVGAGPGDPKLITLRGVELIAQADVIIYDYLANRELLKFAKDGAELIYVGKQAARHELPQKDINSLLVEKARQRERVVRLKGGDPFIFGRGGEEIERLAKEGIEFEIVPGITSAIAAPAYAGIPLTHRDYASSVSFITGHEDESKETSAINWQQLATATDTLVFLMGMKNITEIKEKLITFGRDPETPACIIQWGTLPTQRVVTGPLKEIDLIARREAIKPPGIILVGNVARLRDTLKWFENKPLFGKRIVVTRAPHQSSRLGSLLADRGAQVVYAPTIEIAAIEPNDRLDGAIDSLSTWWCIIVTSVNAVTVFLEHLFRRGKDIRALHGVRILPIGDATAASLRANGIVADAIPEHFTSEGVIEVLAKIGVKGRRFLLPRAEEARDVIVEYIRVNGGECQVVPIYRATVPETIAPLSEKPDVITFTSSSTVKNFLSLYGKPAIKGALIASIGPVTTETLEAHGITVDMAAATYDIPGLVTAIEDHFKIG